MRIEVADIEMLNPMFLYVGFDLVNKTYVSFELSEYNNELEKLVKHLLDSKIDYLCTFNGISYDMQILQYILDNHRKWYDMSNKQIITLIKKFSNKVIDDLRYDLFPPYREEQFYLKQIDLFKIHHFDNEARRTSLKWLQFSMDFHNVEEMPYAHDIDYLTKEQVQEIKDYCINDVESTCRAYDYTVGEVEHGTYKGKNKILDRLNLIKEEGFPEKAISWADVKLGDEYNKLVYCKLTGITPDKLYEMKKNRKSTAGFTYGQCIPKYVQFKTKAFQDFFNVMKNERVNLMEKKEYPFSYNGTNYMIAKGGIHSNEKNRIIIVGDDEYLEDADIGSQYPHALIKRKLFPSHLGEGWLKGYTQTRDKRLDYKSRIKKAKDVDEKNKYTGLSETFKLALNGGGFGKTNEKNSWQYDPFVHFSCTIGNQFEILMLIEMLEVVGIHVVSANTDGIVSLYKREQEKDYYVVCNEWEKIVGNDVQGKLEFARYSKLVQATVNDYIAIKPDGEIKRKGDFLIEFDLNKNKSKSIINRAVGEYFINGTDVEKTIREHKSIFEFLIGAKASKDYHYENVDISGQKDIYHRLIRYYISKSGKKLLKIKNEDSESTGPDISQTEAGEWRMIVLNKITNPEADISSYNIDYDYYITKAKERISSIESGKKKNVIQDKNQLSLF